jgi:hypothetical protein
MSPLERIMVFLRESGASDIRHARSNLFDHLVGTHNLLASWGCDTHVQYAGILHSIYGTRIFKKKLVSYDKRAEIASLIGDHAETLVYLYSLVDRPLPLLDAYRQGFLRDGASAQKIEASTKTITELLEIECANLLEQGGGDRFFKALRAEISRKDINLRKSILSVIQII